MTVRRRFGTGYLQDRPDPNDYDASDLIGAPVAAPPKSAGVEPWVRYVADQGHRNSCVGQAIAQGLSCLMALEKSKIDAVGPGGWVRPSADFIYYNARRVDRIEHEDLGSRPRSAFLALSKHGYCPEEVYPSVGADTLPPWSAYQQAIDQGAVRYYRIGQLGAPRGIQIRSALASGFPVTLALTIDDTYFATDGDWHGAVGKIAGGHYVCCTHYDEKGLWHVGSYGLGWGRGGYCRVPWEVIESGATNDVWVLQYAPVPGEKHA